MYAIYCESEECERGAGLLSVGNISALALKVKQHSTQCSDWWWGISQTQQVIQSSSFVWLQPHRRCQLTRICLYFYLTFVSDDWLIELCPVSIEVICFNRGLFNVFIHSRSINIHVQDPQFVSSCSNSRSRDTELVRKPAYCCLQDASKVLCE